MVEVTALALARYGVQDTRTKKESKVSTADIKCLGRISGSTKREMCRMNKYEISQTTNRRETAELYIETPEILPKVVVLSETWLKENWEDQKKELKTE